ncbi:MAG: hypothetical protein JNK45_24550, partial [Myxococcales bacterium]|nr:hypothetical protein [Myxococcales bacterium]
MPSRTVRPLALALCVTACTPDEVLSAGSSSSGDPGTGSSVDSGPIADTGELDTSGGWSSTSPSDGST